MRIFGVVFDGFAWIAAGLVVISLILLRAFDGFDGFVWIAAGLVVICLILPLASSCDTSLPPEVGPARHMAVTDKRLDFLGYEKLPVSNTAIGLQSIPSGAKFALIQSETQDIRWRADGNPTDTYGMLLVAGSERWFFNRDLSSIRFIRKTDTDGVLHVGYFGW